MMKPLTDDEAFKLLDKAFSKKDFRCALWNDGSLQIVRGVLTVARLSPDETRELIRYLVATNAGEGI